MLDSISVKNLGCFDDRDHKLNLSKLNVIVGPNNSGKSIIFKFLNLLKQDICNNNFFNNISGRGSATSDSEVSDSIHVSSSLTYYFERYNYFKFEEIIYNHESKEITLGISAKDEFIDLFVSERGMAIRRNTGKSNIKGLPEHMRELFESIHYVSANRNEIKYDTILDNNRDPIQIKSVNSTGSNLVEFLHQRHSDDDSRYSQILKWIQKIDSSTSILKTPIASTQISITTHRYDGQNKDMNVKLNLQGDGIKNALVIISAIMFASKGSTIIIDEPETHLHANAIEVLVDLFNHAVNELELQIIIITHSFEIINCYCSDVGLGNDRGSNHEKIDPDNFKLIVFGNNPDESKIQQYDIKNKKYSDVRSHLKEILG